MFMRNGARLVAFILLVAVLAVGGAALYQVGLTDGFAQGAAQATDGTGPVIVPYGYGWHGGFGIVGFLVTLFFLFLIFGLIRAVMFGGRHHWGPGSPWGAGWKHGPGGTSPWAGKVDDHLAAWHKEAHGEAAPPGPGDPADPSAR